MDLSKIKDLKDLQALLELMGKFDLEELELEGDGQKIRFKKVGPAVQREIVGYGYPAGFATPGFPASPGAHPAGAPLSAASGAAAGPPALPTN